MTAPLVQIGPGGAYTTTLTPSGSRLLANNPAGEGPSAAHAVATGAEWRSQRRGPDSARQVRRSTLLERLLGIDRVELSDEALEYAAADPSAEVEPSPLLEAACSWLAAQRVAVQHLQQQVAGFDRRLTRRAPVSVSPTTRRVISGMTPPRARGIPP